MYTNSALSGKKQFHHFSETKLHKIFVDVGVSVDESEFSDFRGKNKLRFSISSKECAPMVTVIYFNSIIELDCYQSSVMKYLKDKNYTLSTNEVLMLF